MRLAYCDRCGVEHREGVKGGRVVTVTWQPLQRTMDLCGSCRTDLQRALDDFLQVQAVARKVVMGVPPELVARTRRHDG